MIAPYGILAKHINHQETQTSYTFTIYGRTMTYTYNEHINENINIQLRTPGLVYIIQL